MKIYTYSTVHYGSGVCIANSEEEAIEIFAKNHPYQDWSLIKLDVDCDGIQVFEIQHGFCHIDIGDT
jgi:hypothetical protein